MKLVYTNSQVYDVRGRWSVAQRRFAWALRKHPRAFDKRTGRHWHFALQMHIGRNMTTYWPLANPMQRLAFEEERP